MNILMCMLVIFIHVASWSINSLDINSIKYFALMVPWKLSAFVVQGFIFLSAVKLFSSSKPLDYEKFLVGRYVKIIAPYVIWVIVYYVYFINHEFYAYVFSWDQFGQYLFFGTLCSHFYFIITIMQFYFNMPIFKWLVSKVNGVLLVVASVVLTALFKQFVHFQYDDRVFVAYLCYFVIGAVIGKNYEKVTAVLKRIWWLLFIPFAIFAFGDVLFTYRAAHGSVFAYSELLHLGYCISAIFFFFAFFLRFFEGKQLWRVVALADKSSYGMYLSHILFVYIANDIIRENNITDMAHAFAVRFGITYGATLVLCMSYTLVKEKIKNARKASRTVS